METELSWLLLLLPLSIGCIKLLAAAATALKWVWFNFLRPAKDLTKYGSWALVSGPTEGIGKAFAFRLAEKGLNLVLVGRNPEKLRGVSDWIRAEFGRTQIQTVVVDFAGDLDDGVQRIRAAIEGLDVGVLINNVGVCYPYPKFFHEVDEKLMAELIRVNVEGTTKVTHAVLPGMLRRKTGAVVNIGSGIALIYPSAPLHAVYAATKEYINQFTKSLNVEYKEFGIDVQCQVPLNVASNMTWMSKKSILKPSADVYARAALRWIGYNETCCPYWPHQLELAFMHCWPDSFVDARRFKSMLEYRKKAQLIKSIKKRSDA
ncbi:unnamed protein product [Cuscuta campestris]|uniref:Very-long-chain 3-oxoacyl-CoA reductase n=1 Tax=Cuscuta campestris TaxID=132261 RepID=A0A484MSS1_9ASTE|nr:unnamed protein product [Cuscuta campestris]